MLQITTLIENETTSEDLKKEHGLSFYIKQDDKKYLMDTGASKKFLQNAEDLGIDLKDLDAVIISHNHSDHIGGLKALLKLNKKVKVYIKSDARSAFYKKFFLFKKYIGEEKGLFEKYEKRFIFIDGITKISDSLKLLPVTIKDKRFMCKDKALLEKKDGVFVRDEFNHELIAVFEEEKGLTVVSSCSHNGIVNIVRTVKKAYKLKPILYVVGGFHMMGFGLMPLNCSKKYIQKNAEILDDYCEKTIYTNHCTGMKAFEIMKEYLGKKIEYINTGSIMDLD